MTTSSLPLAALLKDGNSCSRAHTFFFDLGYTAPKDFLEVVRPLLRRENKISVLLYKSRFLITLYRAHNFFTFKGIEGALVSARGLLSSGELLG